MALTACGFGLLTAQRHPADRRTWPEIYAEAVELAVLAEELGFDSVWTSEHHFFDDGYLASQMPVLAAIASRTDRIRLGPCVVLLPLYEPLHLAEEVVAVDLLSGGRLIFGAGLGWREEELAAYGVASGERVSRLVSTLGFLRDAWAGRTVSARVDAPAVFVTPAPARPGGPPVWLAAMVTASAERAGRLAEGFVATKVDPSTLGRLEEAALEGRRAAGRDGEPITVAVHHPVFAWRGDDAWRHVEPFLHYMDWKYDDMTPAWGRAPGGVMPPTVGASRRADLQRASLWGSPECVAEGITRYADAVGGELHFIARSFFPGMDPGIQRESMRIFADEVIPLVRSQVSDSPGRSNGAS